MSHFKLCYLDANTKEASKKNETKKEEVKKEEAKKEDTSKKNEATPKAEINNANTSNNTEANNNTPAPAPASEPACTHPQTYIKSGMHLRTESLGGGCVREIEAAEDICLTCGAVVRSYEREGQVGHAGYHISGDAKAPTCTEDGYDYTTVTCDCGGYVNTNNSTEPAYGHAYHDECTGDISEDQTKARYITVCYRCGDIANEWWE